MGIKLNVVNREYKFRIRNIATGIEKDIIISAESEEAARLKLPEGYEDISKSHKKEEQP